MGGSVYRRCTTCGTSVKSRSGFATQREADRKMRELLAKVDAGTRVERSDLTLAAYLRDEWLPATAPPRVGHGTHLKRTGHVETYIVPRIGGVPLQELNAAHVNRLYTELLTSGKADGTPLAASTCHDVHRTLRRALADAVRWGLAEHNATDRSDPPPVRAVEAERRAALRVWTPDELAAFLAASEGHRHHRLWEVAASSGARRSELLGLRWRSVDLAAGTATIRDRVVRGPDGYRLEDGTKSDRSARVVDLDARTVAILRALKVEQNEARLAAGPAWVDLGLVFTDEHGRWLSPPGVSQTFKRAVAHCTTCSAPLDTARRRERHDASDCAGGPHPPLTLHGLRHTHATLLLKAGVPLHVVSRRLGHASEAFTAAVYAHVLPGQQREAAETFSRLVFGDASGA
jgi:integrase